MGSLSPFFSFQSLSSCVPPFPCFRGCVYASTHMPQHSCVAVAVRRQSLVLSSVSVLVESGHLCCSLLPYQASCLTIYQGFSCPCLSPYCGVTGIADVSASAHISSGGQKNRSSCLDGKLFIPSAIVPASFPPICPLSTSSSCLSRELNLEP